MSVSSGQTVFSLKKRLIMCVFMLAAVQREGEQDELVVKLLDSAKVCRVIVCVTALD